MKNQRLGLVFELTIYFIDNFGKGQRMKSTNLNLSKFFKVLHGGVMRNVLVLGILLTAISSLADVLPTQNQWQASAPAQLYVRRLVEILKPRVSVLDRELVTFRYSARNNFMPGNLDEVNRRINGSAEIFFDENQVSIDVAGPGTYLAIDPFSSRAYGKDQPQLYVLNLKKGTRLIDFNTPLSELESNLFKTIGTQFKCLIHGSSQLPDSYDFVKLRQSDTLICRQIIIQAFAVLNIKAIVYEFGAANNLKACRERNLALNLISSQAIDFSKTNFYSDSISLFRPGNDLSSFVKSIYQESIEDYNLQINTSLTESVIPKGLSQSQSINEIDYLNWKKKYILNCGLPWSIETDRPTSVFHKALYDSKKHYYSEEIRNLIFEFRKAFDLKNKQDLPFNLFYFTNFLKLLYSNVNYKFDPIEFNRFAKIMTEGENTDNLDEVKDVFKTNSTSTEMKLNESEMEKKFGNVLNATRPGDDLKLKLYQQMGYSYLYSVYLLNLENNSDGLVLISSSSKDADRNQNFELSLQREVEELKKCLGVYKNGYLSFEDTLKTECEYKNTF